MAAEASGYRGSPGGRPSRTHKNRAQTDADGARTASGKPMPEWLSSSKEEGLSVDLADPEDLLRKLENVDLSEEETEELLKRAYQINKQLKEIAGENPAQRAMVGSAPQAMGEGGRPRSRGTTLDGDHLPNLQRGRHTALSSGAYSRVTASSPTSSQGSARYTSYHGAQAAYGVQFPHPPGKDKKTNSSSSVLYK